MSGSNKLLPTKREETRHAEYLWAGKIRDALLGVTLKLCDKTLDQLIKEVDEKVTVNSLFARYLKSQGKDQREIWIIMHTPIHDLNKEDKEMAFRYWNEVMCWFAKP